MNWDFVVEIWEFEGEVRDLDWNQDSIQGGKIRASYPDKSHTHSRTNNLKKYPKDVTYSQ